MILPPTNTAQYEKIKDYEQLSGMHSPTDYGAWRGMTASFQNGMYNNVTMTLGKWLTKNSLADDDAPAVTKDQFDQTNAYKYGLEYKSDENEAQLEWRIHQGATNYINNEYISGRKRTVRNIGAAFAGGMLTDPLSYIPIALPSKAGALGSLNVLAGRRAAAAYHTGRGTFKNVLAINAGYEVPYAFMQNDLGVQKYTIEQLQMSAMMNLGFAGLFSGISGYSANRSALRNKNIIRQDEQLQQLFEAGDIRSALLQAAESDNFVLNTMLDQAPELRDWAAGRSTTPLTKDQDKLATAILNMHETHLQMKALSVASAKKLVPKANKESVKNLLRLQKRQMQRLNDLILFGRGADNIKPTDATLLKEMGFEIVDAHQVHPEVKSIVPDSGFISEPAKVYGSKLMESVFEADQLRKQVAFLETVVEEYSTNPDSYAKQTMTDAEIAPMIKEALQKRAKFEAMVGEITKTVGNHYGRILQDAQNVVDNIMYGKEGVTKLEDGSEMKLKSSGRVALGFIRRERPLVTYINQPYFFLSRSAKELGEGATTASIAGEVFNIAQLNLRPGGSTKTESLAFISVFRTLFHETIHHIETIDPKSFNIISESAIQALGAEKGASVTTAIYKYAESLGYQKLYADVPAAGLGMFPGKRLVVDQALEEVTPLLVEYAITQPAFWNKLKELDPELYAKMGDIMDYLSDTLDFTLNKYGSSELNQSIKKVLKPKGIFKKDEGERIATTISDNLIKIKNDSEFKNIVARTVNEQDNYNPFFDVEDAELSIASFEGNAKDHDAFLSDPTAFIDDAVTQLLGGDETVLPALISLTKLNSQKLPPALNTFVEEMEQRGHGWITKDVASEMIGKIQAATKRNKQVAKIVLRNKDFEATLDGLIKLTNEGLPLEVAQRVGYILLDEKNGSAAQIGRVNNFLETEAHAAILRSMHDEVTYQGLNSLVNKHRSAKKKIDQLSTFLDGSRRNGVDLGVSLGTYKTIQKQLDQNPLLDYLIDNGLFELFLGEDPTKYMSSYLNTTIRNKDLIKLYGDDLKQASMTFHKDIMLALSSGKIPKKWKGVEVWEGLIGTIRKTNKNQLAQMNALGITIRDRKGFLGYSMTYDRAYVKSMGYAAFETKMLAMIDMKETIKAHGGLMAERPSSTKSGLKDAGKHKKFNKKTFLRGLYNEIVEGEFIQDTDINNPSVLGGYRKAAKVVFKPSKRIDALIEFGNRKNMGRFMLEQIAARSENIALVKHAGHDANGRLLSLIPPQATALSKLKTKATIDQVTGMLDTPVDANLSSIFRGVRQVQNIAMLGGAGFSSLSDIPLVWSTLQYLGVGSEGMGVYFSRYQESISAQFNGDNKLMAQWFRQQGAAFDLITRNMAQRVITDEAGAGGKINSANDFMFEVNFLNRLTASHQQLFVDMLTSGLAEQLRAKNMNPLTEQRLLEFGFTKKEIVQLAKYVEKTPDGIYRIGPYNITNTKLQSKLSGFMNQYMREGVIEPDVGAQALSRLGLQAGTISGETARLALQYSSFMIAMGRVIYRRFLYGYNGDKKTAAFRNAHMFAYFGMALAAAYLSTVLKDMSRFKAPMNPLDMTEQEWMRIIRQSGLLAYYEPFFNAAQFGTDAAFGPAVGTATDIASLDFGDAIEPYTGQHLPVLGPIIKQTAHTANEIIFNFLGEETERSASAPIDND